MQALRQTKKNTPLLQEWVLVSSALALAGLGLPPLMRVGLPAERIDSGL
jgi:hypothetical protein